MGGVVNAKYDFSLSDWWWLSERYDLLSFVTISSCSNLLVRTPTNVDIDFGLFVRPFSHESWLAILSLTAIATIVCVFMTQNAIPNTKDRNGQTLMVTTLWYFFVLIYAF
jgi:hypothetical protein